MPACAPRESESVGVQSERQTFYEDVVAGLHTRPKILSPKHFYDARGSQLFDQICALDEYYLYQTELHLLSRVTQELAEDRHSPLPSLLPLRREVNLVEFGAGSLRKVVPLLQHLSSIRRYTAIDISGSHLQSACAALACHFPDLEIQIIEGDFSRPLSLPAAEGLPVGFFPGSTIGNFSPPEAVQFLETVRQTLGPGSYMLMGVDTKKDPGILSRAYNDRAGVTARFNKNVLARINRELGGNFNLDQFEHYAWYNEEQGRVEMHLLSTRAQQVSIGEASFHFSAQESIHTENSYKYHPDEFTRLAEKAGWTLARSWLAEGAMFSILLLTCDR